MTKPEEFLHFVVKALVDYPDQVSIVRSVDPMGVLYTLDLSPEDMGKVIGRKGNTAKAIRTLLRVVGTKYDERANLKINEPEGGMQRPSPTQSMDRQESSDDTQGSVAPSEATAEMDAAIADLKDDMSSL